MEATLGNPATDVRYKFTVTTHCNCSRPIKLHAAAQLPQVSFKIDNLVYSYGTPGFGAVRSLAFE